MILEESNTQTPVESGSKATVDHKLQSTSTILRSGLQLDADTEASKRLSREAALRDEETRREGDGKAVLILLRADWWWTHCCDRWAELNPRPPAANPPLMKHTLCLSLSFHSHHRSFPALWHIFLSLVLFSIVFSATVDCLSLSLIWLS